MFCPMPATLPPLYALQAFVTAARRGSFTGAAGEMHLTQSAVSRQVALLEQHFGCPLFVRGARALTLTAEGRQLLPAVQAAFETLAQAGDALMQARGVLTLQLPPTFASRWFLPRLPLLRAALPELELRIATHWAVAPDFGRPDVDAVIAHGAGGWPNLVELPLMREMLTPLCAPALRSRLRRVDDLAAFTLLHPDPQRREWSQWLTAAGASSVKPRSGQVFDTVDMALSTAVRGQGVAIADPALLHEALADGVLVMPFKRRVASGMSYFLTYPQERAGSRKLAAFQGWLLAQFEPGAGRARSAPDH
jgi:DNA-binding transcriptional LysR family regulator